MKKMAGYNLESKLIDAFISTSKIKGDKMSMTYEKLALKLNVGDKKYGY